MNKLPLHKPVLLILIGNPGAGKTHFSRQFAEKYGVPHLNGQRLSHEADGILSDSKSRTNLSRYMCEELLRSGASVLFDEYSPRQAQRHQLAQFARKFGASALIVWVQTDLETSYRRAASRDKRKIDDRYESAIDQAEFEKMVRSFQRPQFEEYVVISGKHTFDAQEKRVISKLQQLGLLPAAPAPPNDQPVSTKPPVERRRAMLGGRVDMRRRRSRT